MNDESDEPAGHYRAAAGALGGMSFIGFTLFIMTHFLKLDFGFIDAWGVLGISSLFAAVGGLMWLSAKGQ